MKKIISLIVILFFIFAQAWGLWMSPPDEFMGHLQKLMYVHVPAAWSAMIAFFLVFVGSLFYLIQKKKKWDYLAASSGEVGVLFTVITLMLGSLWGKPTWGVWWTWDPRLTSTAVMCFLYIGYLLLRRFINDPDKRARISAPLGVLIFLNVPIVYYSVMWWRTLHQNFSTPKTVDPAMTFSLRLNAFAFLFLLLLFIYHRYQLAKLEAKKEDALSLPPRGVK